MRRLLVALSLLVAIPWSAPAHAQARNQLGPLCTTDTTPAEQMIDACSKIIALKVFRGEQLATIHFWRAVGWNKKGNYSKVIADATEAIRLQPSQAGYNLRGSAYYDKGDYEIAVADFDDALKLGPPSGTIFHNRGNAWRGKHDFAKAIADYDMAIKADPKSAFSFQNRGISKQALGDLDGALADINQAIRLDPSLPQPLINRTAIWRAKGELDRAIADGSEAIRLAKDKPPVNIMTPPNSVLISGYTNRALTYEAKGDYARARDDYQATLAIVASDAGSKANQATAKVRLSLLTDAGAPIPRDAPSPTTQPANNPASQQTGAAPAPSPASTARGVRMALIIGNGAYAHVKALPNPANDARAVAKSLRDIGFTVSEGIDLDRAAMQKMTREFLREAARAQVALVYYAGHGVQVDGRNYLIPVDVALKPGAAMTEAMIDMDTIMAGLDDQVRTNILIFDACRNNPMAQQVASAGTNRGIESASGLAAPTSLGAGATLGAGTLIAFATAPGQVALDGEGANSPFSAALSRHIGTPGLEVQQMLTRVRAEVVSTTRNKQVPWSNSSLLGEVYLAEK
ncbi:MULTISPECIES: caspase family protein [unclassified Bradyrhizobium]|uniref:caspase family protein n=1 Tax=unclassified Bradyrhizobium TaxID=2631580 RepID=UPI00211E21B8|nr:MULTISPECIES: caspase family protein [unclassified Bradyrhizobium]MDD1535107.1 peptidase C14, caspase catalytic subunit p20 [Bradyrhizobium sp. WBOS8]MDD1584775.1 peptidase C14, caspase catalytic subunit p20 [Bradyrhizobium sp. WBOS4]UUO50212.1 peptidase C14, caspase catalytic subunit p20 [Bradyrhizobium sp. WBOS04]UUO58978.1 peptidase C14, caspase catalytic subunit p20 [Bradyrhizobium sp. WBOS08]